VPLPELRAVLHAFDRHRVAKLDTPERRCLTLVVLHNSGWRQGPPWSLAVSKQKRLEPTRSFGQ
jgi:hypothetical protein